MSNTRTLRETPTSKPRELPFRSFPTFDPRRPQGQRTLRDGAVGVVDGEHHLGLVAVATTQHQQAAFPRQPERLATPTRHEVGRRERLVEIDGATGVRGADRRKLRPDRDVVDGERRRIAVVTQLNGGALAGDETKRKVRLLRNVDRIVRRQATSRGRQTKGVV